MLWRKRRLSTERHAFTITINLYTSYRYNNKTNSNGKRQNTLEAPSPSQKKSPDVKTRASNEDEKRLQARAVKRQPYKKIVLQTKRMWKSRCISTGADVQNTLFTDTPTSYPRSVSAKNTVFQPTKKSRKPLMLWSKQTLSTVNVAFTITINFVYILIK